MVFDCVTVFVHSRAQLEADKVFDVVVNPLSFLDGRPESSEQIFYTFFYRFLINKHTVRS